MINGLAIYYSKNVGRGLKPVSKTASGLKPVSNQQKVNGLKPVSEGGLCKKYRKGLKYYNKFNIH